MVVKIKKLHPNAVTPKYAKDGDAGLDIIATHVTSDFYQNIVYHTGISIEIPIGYVGLLFPRSSNSKKDVWLTNHVGVIDSGYRGEILFKYRHVQNEVCADYWVTDHKEHLGIEFPIYKVGDRIGQLIIMPYPQIEFEESDELSETERGINGYGSTGN